MSNEQVRAEYSQGVCGDGAAILKDGQRMTIDEIVAELNQAAHARYAGESDAVTDEAFRKLVLLIDHRANMTIGRCYEDDDVYAAYEIWQQYTRPAPAVPDDVLESLWRHTQGIDPETGKQWLTPRMIATAKRLEDTILSTSPQIRKGKPPMNQDKPVYLLYQDVYDKITGDFETKVLGYTHNLDVAISFRDSTAWFNKRYFKRLNEYKEIGDIE